MLFGEYILKLRARLQDRYDVYNNLITDIAIAGRRWSADELIEVANNAILEVVRYVHLYANTPLGKRLAESVMTIQENYNAVNGTFELNENVISIISLGSALNTYAYKPSYNFFELKKDTAGVYSTGKFYTLVTDMNIGKLRVYLNDDYTGTISTTSIYAKINFGIASNNVIVPYFGLDDILLDIAERECREREGNYERAQVLDNRIIFKLTAQIGNKNK